VGTDDGEPQAAVAHFAQPARPGPAHIAITLVLLVLHFILTQVSLGVVGLSVMSTDSCAYVACGDQRWVNRAVALTIYGGGALLLGSVIIAVWRLVKGRKAIGVAVTGCVLQVFLAFIALMTMGLAGPTG
jgi:hypothetical protein